MPNMYESMVVFDGSLDEDSAKGVTTKLESFLKDNGAEIVKTDVWGRRELAYNINKKRAGYYVLYVYTAAPTLPLILEKLLRSDEKVLRHLTLDHDPNKRTASMLPKITDTPRDMDNGDDDDMDERPRGRRGRDDDRDRD